MEGQLDYLYTRGVDIHVVIPDDGYYSKMFNNREKNVVTHHIPIKRDISLFNDIKNVVTIYNLFKSVRADIVHLHTPKASFLGAIAGRLSSQRIIIYQMHGLVSARGNISQKASIFFIERLTCLLATKIYAVSESIMLFAIKNKYCRREKISVIGNGSINGIDYANRFNPDKIDSKKKYLNRNDVKNKFVIGFVGRISVDKGIEDYLKVLDTIKKKIPVLGVVVGPNEMGDKLKYLLEKYDFNSSQIIILDFTIDPENVICDFDVLLFPSKREGFGLIAAESNSLKKPVVAYKIPGIIDAVKNNSSGILVDYGDINQLCNAIGEYYINPGKKIEHGNNGRERVKRLFQQDFLWSQIYDEYKSLLKVS